jgi:hypothetical protein
MRILVAAFMLIWTLGFSTNLHGQAPRLALQSVVQDRLTGPLFVTNAHDETGRLFILEQRGRVLVAPHGATSSSVFLDLTDKVLTGTERGLLGLAFHPQFSENHRFFLDYTRKPDGAIVVAEYRVSATNPNAADGHETVVMTIPHPIAEHNGGMIEFGPDGFLYISTGDGGVANDPQNNAQSLNSLLGKILRIDIDHPASASVHYSSPPSNPFFGAPSGLDEIYALGLRNPWRFSFDRATGEIYAGDVGQDALEEIDVIEAGGNYGWRVFEGTLCRNLGPGPCTPENYVPPILDYGHTGRGGRCSITGGYVYRGNKQTLPFGAYIYGDYCTGEIFMLYHSEQQLLLDTTKQITSFGEDEDGELFVVGGTVDRIVNTGSAFTPTTRFDLTGGGSASFLTGGVADQISIEHAQIQPNNDDSRTSALAFISFRQNGVLVSESAVPATSLLESGRIYAEIGDGADTGLAIANPDMARFAVVTFNFTDAEGNDFGGSAVVVPAGGQISAFLDETPFYGPSVFTGTLTFVSSVPLSVIAVRGLINQRSEFLTTTLPVVDISTLQTEPLQMPQFAVGGGWTTDVVLVNPTDELISGTVQFLTPAGQVQATMLDGTVRGAASYAIAARSSRKLRVGGRGPVFVGSFVVAPDSEQITPALAAIYTYTSGGITVGATGAEAGPPATEFDVYSEVYGKPGTVGSIDSGVAIASTSAEETDVSFEIDNLDGSPSGIAGTLQIPPNGQTNFFLDQLPGAGDLPSPFQGTLRLSSSAPVAVLAIRGRYNERGDFLLSATPPAYPLDTDQAFIPQVVDGAGYTTQIVIFGGSEDSPVSGNIYFFDQSGRPISPNLQ